ncbi:MAG: DnaA/Hda family protein [Nitrospinaceae bacterium]
MPEKEFPSRQIILDFPSGPEYSFSNFIVSKGSRFAVNAAKQITSDESVPYNTLYLFGDKGLGKTHLLMSIGNHLAEHRPEKKVLYVHGAEFVRNIEEGDASAANQTLSKLLDVDFFLLDDVDRISGKRTPQEKLYHIYNSLTEKNRKIVFAGGQNPERLGDTEDYLKSRFKWGMTAEIKPIDDATTAKILSKLGLDAGLSVPDKVVEYLLARIPRDFPSIKNAVEKINHESYVQKRKVTLAMVKSALDLS